MFQLTDQFKRENRRRHAERLRRQRWFVKARKDQERREQIAGDLEEDFIALVTDAVLASEIQIAEFESTLKVYDTATTAALMENQALLEAIEERLGVVEGRLEGVWQHANVMEDGRRVFLTADRTQAYDEFGEQVSREEYDYGLFPQDHVPVDGFLDDLKERGSLFRDRKNALDAKQRIHAFDGKVKDAQQEAKIGKMTEDRLEELSEDLEDMMPPEIARHIPGYKPAARTTGIKTGFDHAAAPDAAAGQTPWQSFQPEPGA